MFERHLRSLDVECRRETWRDLEIARLKLGSHAALTVARY